MDKEKMNDLIKSGIFGLVVADALGVPYEFHDSHWCEENLMTDMIGYGTYNQPPGTWSDDSSLALASLYGLSNFLEFDEEKRDDELILNNFSSIIDYEGIMENFIKWYDNGDFSPYGEVFDIGTTTLKSFLNYQSGNVSAIEAGGSSEGSNGNGSIMRILPIAFVIYFLSKKYSFSDDEKMKAIHNLSSLTHGHKRAQMGCGIYVTIAIELIGAYFGESDLSLEEIVNNGITKAKEYYFNNDIFKHQLEHYNRVFSLDIHKLQKDEINSGGYVVSTLEASIWCLLNNDNYKDTALAAVNLGNDTDTTACVVGGLAGIYYGYDDIPTHWLDQIAKFDFIEDLIDKFEKNLYEIIGD